jgi:hypothetical protein
VNPVFCTLFDERYAAKGLTLYRTLTRHRPGTRLVIFCMDEGTERLVESLRLRDVRAVPLRALEEFTPELLRVRPERSVVEYYWTLTPAACRYVLHREPGCDAVTYVDADVMMFADPEPVFAEMAAASVLLVPHGYPPRWKHWEKPGGIYNVQFMVFRNDDRGRAAVDWWHDRCLEWCFDRHEPGRFGDQKYLDDWPERFAGVHVLRHHGGGLGPWNAGQYEVARDRDGRVTVGGDPLLFFHFSSLEILLDRGAVRALRALDVLSHRTPRVPSFGWVSGPVPLAWRFWPDYPVTAAERALIWVRYAQELSVTLAGAPVLESRSGGSAKLEPVELARLAAITLLPPAWRRRMGGARRRLLGVRAEESR